MAFIEKYTSSKEIIDRVYADCGFQEDIDWVDGISWIYDFMQVLNYPLQYIPRVKGWKDDESYDFTDFRIKLPCDYYSFGALAVDGLPARPSTNAFHQLKDGECCKDTTSTPSSAFDVFTDNFGNTFNSLISNFTDTVPVREITYTINSNYITFNVKEGKACLAYYAMPVDKDNFPLIPDDVKYKIALTKFLIMKIDYKLWRAGRITDKIFAHSEKEYEWAVGSVSAHLKTPNVQQMEVIKNMLLRLKPEYQGFSTFFRNIGRNTGHRN